MGLGRDNGRTRSNGLRAQTGIEPHMGQRRFVGEHNRMGKLQQVRGQSLHEGASTTSTVRLNSHT